MSEQKKVKNNAVEFWRIVFTIGVMFFHFNLFARLMGMGQFPMDGIFKGGFVLGFFLFLTGYFMMASYMKKDAKGLIDRENAYKPAWGYFWSRYKGLVPPLVLGTLLSFILRNIAVGTPLKDIPVYLMRAAFEFVGLYQIGMNGMSDSGANAQLSEILGQQAPSGPLAGISSGATPLWMGPGWYISAIIVVSVIIYWILCKHKDFFIGVFCPLMIIGYYGYTGMTGLESSNVRESLNFLQLPGNIMRVTAGLCVGCLMYFVVQWIKDRQVAENHKVGWGIFATIVTLFSVYTLWAGIEWSETQNNFPLILMTVIALVGKDPISNFLNGPMGKISGFLGKISLYFYVGHWGWLAVLPVWFPDMAYLPMAGLYVLFTTITAVVFMLIHDKCIKPLLDKPKQKIAAA
jgi:peptidoglycan/LPS O-acetylase OafA/YrhL